MTSRIGTCESVVVIVDDNRDVRTSLSIAARALGFEPVNAASGAEALPVILERGPHVVFIDLCMPGLSGWDLARRVRGSPLAHQPRLVAITGLTGDVIRARSIAAGFDDHLLKPIGVHDMKRALAYPAT